MSRMKREAAEILKDALALPTEARAALAGSLLERLDTEVDEDADAAWATEVNRRVAGLDSSAVNTIPWAGAPPTRHAMRPPFRNRVLNQRLQAVAVARARRRPR
jgi:hypothetical protein